MGREGPGFPLNCGCIVCEDEECGQWGTGVQCLCGESAGHFHRSVRVQLACFFECVLIIGLGDRWEPVSSNLYKYSVEYDANGVGDVLLEDIRLRLDGDPRTISFLILYVPPPLQWVDIHLSLAQLHPTPSQPASLINSASGYVRSLL